MGFLDHIWLVPLLPLASALVMLLFGRRLKNVVVSWLSVGSVFLSFLFSAGAFLELLRLPAGQRVFEKVLFTWIPAGLYHTSAGALADLNADWGYLVDPLSAVMILVVSGVGFIIHFYSIGYMGHEGGYYRFFGYLNLFMFSMLTLVLANNFVEMFVGWEGVGLCSYLLIGFYFLKKSASDAGKKAFIVNRVGDSGFLLAIFLITTTFGTVRFTEVSKLASEHFAVGDPTMLAIALLLFLGATGKSAQIPLYTWLPDAMEGPTPVSALIHAATMVTAGVYMVSRANAIYQLAPAALEVVAIIGALTAIYAASMGLVQTDIKRILAYSTISQLGYMFLACGVGAFGAGIFHLSTHAYFKALLFLGAGSVMHALSGELDIRKMGALRDKIPTTFKTFFIATLAICGLPPLAGFFSKDEIIWQSISSPLGHWALYALAVVTAAMTAFYMFRILFLAFYGESRGAPEVAHHIHESPWTMTVPLQALAVLSVIGGLVGIPAVLGGWLQIPNWFEEFLAPVFAHGETLHAAATRSAGQEFGSMFLSVLVVAVGIWLAYRMYLEEKELPARLAERFQRAYNLLYRKYYMDEIYDLLFVNRAKDLGTAWARFDLAVVDGGVNGAGWLTRASSRFSIWSDTWIVDGLVDLVGIMTRILSYPVRLVQTGLVQGYALFIVLGLLIFMGYYILR